jgi:hypothetical protein
VTGEVDILILSVIKTLRPQEETQNYIAQFPQRVTLLSSCRKNMTVGMCAQNMILDVKKFYLLCAVTNYKYGKSSKNTTIYSVIFGYVFRPERP